MSTVALQNVWRTIMGFDLTVDNKRWIADHLYEQIEESQHLSIPQPYTIVEINAMIDQSEADFAAGRVYSMEEARQHRNEHRKKLLSL